MFGEYLKQLRTEQNLTQKELCAHLNLVSTEFEGIEVVSVSRWERGVTTPHPVRACKILRTLTTNLTPYLDSLETQDPHGFVTELIYDRYYSAIASVNTVSYSSPNIKRNREVTRKVIDSENHVAIFECLRGLVQTSKTDYPHFSELNLDEQYREGRLLVKVYVDNATSEIVGHHLALLFNASDLEKYLVPPFSTLPLETAKPYSKNEALAVCSLSRFAIDEHVFRMLHSDFLRFLATHSNIQCYYHYINLGITLDYFTKIGAEKVGFDTPDPYGVIKVGSKTFRNCLVKIDTATYLTRPEVLFLMKNT